MKFPAGKYYVGDLCYAINDWGAFCDLTISGSGCLSGDFPWKDKHLWANTTAYGDGYFHDEEGKGYSVDAGLIGILPAELMDKDGDGGHVHDFLKEFRCEYFEGIFHIGDLIIDTN